MGEAGARLVSEAGARLATEASARLMAKSSPLAASARESLTCCLNECME